ncbi:60S ribosomal protein L24 [Hondaea fermentalgiana]|uniref:60S ribosomal protein L24 n=1 Tax=Hondaea fermentalgiana TaxID=2315210 RepID=A0A2R5G1S5_9STRA|nr:60S ribosomal protein L24 [Hondaea fermentalgiana]|eukprot:GBG24485.1 60S ribosomal protein L24 [Hondaea fermentalgiana]
MVVKTDVCSYTEFKIYPGHGIKFVRKDGQPLVFINSKAMSLYQQKIKPTKLTWTTGWRRLNKKDKRDDGKRIRRRKVAAKQKPIVGLSLDQLKKKRDPKEKSAAREAAQKEVQARQKKSKKVIKK